MAAVAYIRVSTNKQEISPEVQLERIRAHCAMKGLQLIEVISERVSARSKPLCKRPEGSKIQAFIASGVSNVVAVKLDRIFRNAADALVTVRAWTDAGIALHLVDMAGISLDTNSSMGTLFLTMLPAFGEFEANVIRDRAAAALRHKKAHGKVYNHVPCGFVREGDSLVPLLEEQAIVSRIQVFRANGWPLRRIAEALNGEGVPTKHGHRWFPQTVSDILNRAAANTG